MNTMKKVYIEKKDKQSPVEGSSPEKGGAKRRGKATAQGAKKTKGRRKRAKVVMPKINNMQKPAGMKLEEWQVALRKLQAEKETFAIRMVDEQYAPGEFRVANAATRNEYKVVYRGKDSLWNYCSCYDFKTSQLGTCKHMEAVKLWVRKKRKKVQVAEPDYSSVYIDYKGPRRVKIRIGDHGREMLERLAKDYFDESGVLREDAYARFDVFVQAAKAIAPDFRCYDDALDYVLERRDRIKRCRLLEEKYTDEYLDQMLTVPLYPYQKEGTRFAVRAGKAIIADEMGLGKTLQAIASAEVYLREGMAEQVLVVCPTSLKYQWKREIERFTGGDRVECSGEGVEDGLTISKVVVVEGAPAKRAKLYKAPAPYKIVSYHTMCNDVRHLGKLDTDVLIMDEIQRLKNWDTLISRAARKIASRYAVLLSGTPMENKLEELYANMELVDQFCLGPYYQFRDQHILLHPETGGIMGYKDLNAIGEAVSNRLLRRTKKGVRLQLPKRSDQFVLVPMTQRQDDLHSEFKWDLLVILNKYRKYHYMTEQDRLRVLKLLGQMRMVADSTFILEQNLTTRSDVKIAEVMNLLDNVLESGDEKVVVFSEWERMTRLVAMELDKRGVRYEYLNGRVPSKRRGELVDDFTTLPESRVFLSTDAGSTGLNLQVASTLINMDLPWNPAVLEQRIARIFRLGQEKPVQIINLVSKGSIEEGMINKLRFKKSMFEGVLDGGADTVFVDESKFKKLMDDLTIVMKATPDAPEVEYVDEEVEQEQKGKTATEASWDEVLADASEPDDESSVEQGASVNHEPLAEHESSPEYEFSAEQEASADHESLATHQSSEGQHPSADHGASAAQGSAANHYSSQGQTATKAQDGAQSRPSSHHASPHPQQLVSQGVSFFSGLAETLKSAEATQQLVDSIVETDKETGETHLKIPVGSKDTVMQMLTLFGKLMNK